MVLGLRIPLGHLVLGPVVPPHYILAILLSVAALLHQSYSEAPLPTVSFSSEATCQEVERASRGTQHFSHDTEIIYIERERERICSLDFIYIDTKFYMDTLI